MGVSKDKAAGGIYTKCKGGSNYSITRRSVFGAAAVMASAAAVTKVKAGGDDHHGHDHDRHDHRGDDHHGGGDYKCFVRGTLVQTASGQRAVEDLRIGDLILTTSGEARPIKWIGRRRLRATLESVPVKVSRFALDASTPSRDLSVACPLFGWGAGAGE
jgi:hypothetical protein